MIFKGSARAGAGELAKHLLRKDTNERVRVLKLSGVAALDVREALAELDAMGAGSQSRRTLYHLSISTPVGEPLTPDQLEIAVAAVAKKLELEDQPYILIEHVKDGRQHFHVVWSRINAETGKAIPDSYNYRRHEEVARELEQAFGHQPVLGAHVRDKQSQPRPERGPTWGEQRQAERSGLTPEEAKKQITALWQQTTTGSDFAAALAAEGWTLARGERRDFVLLDPAGEVHSLTRRIDGAKAAQVRKRMADVSPEQLPTVQEARQQRPTIEPEPEPPPSAPPPDFTQERHRQAREAYEAARIEATGGGQHAHHIDAPPDVAGQQREQEARQMHAAAFAEAKKEVTEHVLPELAKSRHDPGFFVQIYTALYEIYDRAMERVRDLSALFTGNTQTMTAPPPSRPPAFDPKHAREVTAPERAAQPQQSRPPVFNPNYARETTAAPKPKVREPKPHREFKPKGPARA